MEEYFQDLLSKFGSKILDVHNKNKILNTNTIF